MGARAARHRRRRAVEREARSASTRAGAAPASAASSSMTTRPRRSPCAARSSARRARRRGPRPAACSASTSARRRGLCRARGALRRAGGAVDGGELARRWPNFAARASRALHVPSDGAIDVVRLLARLRPRSASARIVDAGVLGFASEVDGHVRTARGAIRARVVGRGDRRVGRAAARRAADNRQAPLFVLDAGTPAAPAPWLWRLGAREMYMRGMPTARWRRRAIRRRCAAGDYRSIPPPRPRGARARPTRDRGRADRARVGVRGHVHADRRMRLARDPSGDGSCGRSASADTARPRLPRSASTVAAAVVEAVEAGAQLLAFVAARDATSSRSAASSANGLRDFGIFDVHVSTKSALQLRVDDGRLVARAGARLLELEVDEMVEQRLAVFLGRRLAAAGRAGRGQQCDESQRDMRLIVRGASDVRCAASRCCTAGVGCSAPAASRMPRPCAARRRRPTPRRGGARFGLASARRAACASARIRRARGRA